MSYYNTTNIVKWLYFLRWFEITTARLVSFVIKELTELYYLEIVNELIHS